MASTYTPINTYTVSGTSTSEINFTSIPATYTDLVVVIQGGSNSSSQNLKLQFNGDTAANYSITDLYGTGSAAGSQRGTAYNYGYVTYNNGGSTGLDQNAIMNIMNYSNTTTYKTVLVRSNNSGTGTEAIVNLWKKTPEAINAIRLVVTTGALVNGSTFTLYGITAA